MDTAAEKTSTVDFSQIFTNLASSAVQFAIKLIIAIVVFFIAWKLINFFMKKLSNSKAFKKIEETPRNFIIKLIKVVLRVVVVVSILMYLGVEKASVLSVIASCGLAIGLALQGGLSNLAGGIILVFLKPFKDGDYIVAGGNEGTVVDIGFFYTTILTIDNKRVFIPNASLTGSAMTNVTYEKTRRVDLDFFVAGDTDITKAREVLLAIAKQYDLVLKDPAPVVIVSGFDSGKIKLTSRFWCATGDYWDVYFGVNELTKAAFEKTGVVMPKPAMDVTVAEKAEK